MFFAKISLVFTISLFLQFTSKAQVNKYNNFNKVTDQKSYTFFDINNIATYFYNNGKSDTTPNGNSGFEYPKGTGKTAVFASGLLWGAKVAGDPNPRVGGTAYRTGLQPGNIQSDGTPADTASERYRIYRVRPDIFPGGPSIDLTAEAKTENITPQTIRTKYEKDWTEWPADLGAPFVDNNNNGIYEPSVDIPGVKDAKQTIWFVANDLDSVLTTKLYGAKPLGIELQVTVWGYNFPLALSNMLFRKYKIINKTNVGILTPTTFDSMYVSMWNDVDLGDAGDDFVGSDTLLSLLYSYNFNEQDLVYLPLPPPAVGFDFLQGPLVDGIGGQDKNKNGIDDALDYGIFNGKKVGPGKINLPMTAAYYFAGGDPNLGDPPQDAIDGSRQFYNFFQGRFGRSGVIYTDIITGQPTTFALNGDPQTGKGWVDGIQLPAGDRRSGSASGPFTMAPGDTQEVVVAEIIGGAIKGSDRLSAIGILKNFDKVAQTLYDNLFEVINPPPAPETQTVELNNKIILDWGENVSKYTATENYNKNGFTFQGYNVYQLSSPNETIENAKRIATFDRIDGVSKITDSFFDVNDGVVLKKIAQRGSDSGILRSITITADSLRKGAPLINGIKYYFAVTAYSYNPSDLIVPNNFENVLNIITAIPHKVNPGVIQANVTTIPVTQTNGFGNADIKVKIVNPKLLTGHKYQLFFKKQDYINDANGNWTKVAPPEASKGSNLKPTDISPSTLTLSAVFGDVAHTLELQGNITLVSPDFDFIDGIKLDFPVGVTINSAKYLNGKEGVIVNRSVFWGDSSQSTDGFITSDITFRLNVTGTLPINVNYTMYDDAWGANNGYADPIANATGSILLTTAGTKRITQNQWAVKDLNIGEIVLDNQTVYDGVDREFGNGPGGSSGKILAVGDRWGFLGANYSVAVDGFEIAVNGKVTFEIPKTFLTTSQTGAGNLKLWGDAQLFGYGNGLNFYNFGGDSIKPIDLTRDLQFRFTGITDTSNNNDTTVISGGAIATAHSRTNANIGRVRGPFELWEVENNRQINYAWTNRNADNKNDFGNTVPGWYRMSGRDYIVPVATPYDSNATITDVRRDSPFSTWLLFFRQDGSSKWATGDVFTITYKNTIIPGTDKFEFSTTAKNFNVQKAKTDIEKINIFPNPFYLAGTGDLNSVEIAVTFSHLPTKAIIRIFNLAGTMIRKLEKDNSSQFFKWDLMNEYSSLVASGLYIAFIEMPNIGETKIIKLAIIQGETVIRKL